MPARARFAHILGKDWRVFGHGIGGRWEPLPAPANERPHPTRQPAKERRARRWTGSRADVGAKPIKFGGMGGDAASISELTSDDPLLTGHPFSNLVPSSCQRRRQRLQRSRIKCHLAQWRRAERCHGRPQLFYITGCSVFPVCQFDPIELLGRAAVPALDSDRVIRANNGHQQVISRLLEPELLIRDSCPNQELVRTTICIGCINRVSAASKAELEFICALAPDQTIVASTTIKAIVAVAARQDVRPAVTYKLIVECISCAIDCVRPGQAEIFEIGAKRPSDTALHEISPFRRVIGDRIPREIDHLTVIAPETGHRFSTANAN